MPPWAWPTCPALPPSEAVDELRDDVDEASNGKGSGSGHVAPGALTGADAGELDHQLLQVLAGEGVVLGGRDEDPAVGCPHAMDPPLAQAGEEGAEDGPDRAGVGVLEDVRGDEHLAGHR